MIAAAVLAFLIHYGTGAVLGLVVTTRETLSEFLRDLLLPSVIFAMGALFGASVIIGGYL